MKEAAVIGVADDIVDHVPVVFVVKRDGADLTEDLLKEFTAKEISEFKEPARLYFIDEPPLTTSGKIDHKKLYDLLPE